MKKTIKIIAIIIIILTINYIIQPYSYADEDDVVEAVNNICNNPKGSSIEEITAAIYYLLSIDVDKLSTDEIKGLLEYTEKINNNPNLKNSEISIGYKESDGTTTTYNNPIDAVNEFRTRLTTAEKVTEEQKDEVENQNEEGKNISDHDTAEKNYQNLINDPNKGAITQEDIEGTGVLENNDNVKDKEQPIYHNPELANATKSAGSSINDMIKDAIRFVSVVDNTKLPISRETLVNFSNTFYNIILSIGVVVAVIIGMIMGIKFMIGSVEEKADIKTMLIPYIIGCIIVFAGFGIWKAVVVILEDTAEEVETNVDLSDENQSGSGTNGSSVSSGTEDTKETITLNKTSEIINMSTNKELKLIATITPANDNTKITWTTSDTDIATVTSTGIKTATVKFKNTGTVVITAKTPNGGVKTCRIIVQSNVTKIVAKSKSIKLELRTTEKKDVTYKILSDLIKTTPTNAADKYNLEWSSSDSKVAKIENGRVVAKGIGTATLTVKSKSNSKVKETIKVTVITNTKTKAIIEKATSWMESIAADNSHGYNAASSERFGQNGEYSCSGLNIMGWRQAGVLVKQWWYDKNGKSHYYQATNIYSMYLKYGFIDVTNSVTSGGNVSASKLQRGDVLIIKTAQGGHVEQYCGNNQMVGARENTDGVKGDSSGGEISKAGFSSAGIQKVLRYVGGK